MSNRVNLTLDITKMGIQNPLIKVRQGDGGFETLRTTVTSNGEPLDLQGWTITFMGTTAGNHKIVDGNVKIVEAPTGIFDYTPSKAWGMDIGDFKIAYFKFVKGDGSASSANFRVRVIEAIDLTQEEAQNYISVVDATIAEAREHLESSLADVSSSVAATSSAASSLAINVSSVASNASLVASSATSNVSSVASSAVSEVTNAASNVSSAAESVVDKLNNISVGGRNLMLGSKDYAGEGWQRIGTITQSDFQGLTSASGSSAWSGPQYKNSFLESQGKITSTNDKYVLTAWANNTGTAPIIIGFYGGEVDNQGYRVATLPANSGWVRIASRPFSFTKTTGLTTTMKFQNTTDVQGGVFKVAGLKLEIGNVPTDWTPAPEDVDNKLSTRNATFTDFNDVAQNMVKYSGSWVIAAQSIANSPLENYYTAKITPGFSGGTDGYIELVPFAGGSAKKYIAVVGSGTLSTWKSFAFDDDVVHKTGNDTIAGDKTFTGNTTMANIKSSSIKTANVTMGLLTLHFQQTAVGVNVYVDGTWSGTFSMSDSYISSGISIPSVISKPQLPVILNIISNGGIGGVTTNSPFKLEVLIDTDGVIKYRAKTLRDNDTAARNSSIVGADSTFYAVG